MEVIEVKASQVGHGSAKAALLSIENMRYIHDDASRLDIAKDVRPDMIVGLHACGSLTDLIIASAMKSCASFVVCTCCFLSNRNLLVDDGKVYYDWLGVDKGDIEVLAGIAERQGDIASQSLGVHTVNALRAAKASGLLSLGESEVYLETFPLSISGRNHVIVGDLSKRRRSLVQTLLY